MTTLDLFANMGPTSARQQNSHAANGNVKWRGGPDGNANRPPHRPSEPTAHIARARASAERRDPTFTARAAAWMLGYLRTHGATSGELLVDFAKIEGYFRPADDRAFGAPINVLARRGLIVECKGEEYDHLRTRRKGHDCKGGRVWRAA